MTGVLSTLQWVVVAAFVTLGVVSVADWSRYRGASRGYLALAICLLASVVVLGRMDAVTGHRLGPIVADVTLVAFLLSGYALLLFRDTVIPLRAHMRALTLAAVVLLTVLTIVARLPDGTAHAYSPLQAAAVLGDIAVWACAVVEPSVRLWLVSRTLPAVQRGRLRALGTGYAGIVMIVLLAVAAGTAATSPAFQLATQAMALMVTPVLYASFAPPRWLRRSWRAREEGSFRSALQDLLLFSPDVRTLSSRAVHWAVRLVGADAGVITTAGGALATQGCSAEEAAAFTAQTAAAVDRDVQALHGTFAGRHALAVSLHSQFEQARLIVVSGPFTPLFGADEMDRLQEYAAAVAVAMDRVELVEHMQHTQEELRRARDEAQAASSTKSDFLATMSHELRTPLNSILGFTGLLRSGFAGEMTSTADDYLERVERNGRVLLELINDVLDLSKLEAGRVSVTNQLMVVEPLARQVAANAQALAGAKGLRLEVEESGASTTTFADPRALGQVLTNLVGNAVKFTDRGSIRIGVRSAGGRVAIDVADTGQGIAEADQQVIFEAFSQVGRADRARGGTGLGLAISGRLAALMGGGISVASQAGAGSCFTIDLPAVAASPALLAPNGERPLVLAIDDDYDALCLLRAQVEHLGFTFAGVQRPELALRAATTLRPAVILLDILFPEMSGWDVLDQLRGSSATGATPVVIVSVSDGEADGAERGVSFLRKPVSEDDLARTLAPYRPSDELRGVPSSVAEPDERRRGPHDRRAPRAGGQAPAA